MKSITVLTPEDTRDGFSLAGVNQVVCGVEEAEDTIAAAVADPTCGILAVDERLLTEVDPAKLKKVEEQWDGVLVVLPPPQEIAEGERDYALQLVRRAIGYHVRLNP